MGGLALGRVDAASDGPPWQVSITSGGHRFVADETEKGGGTDAGPGPFGLWLSGLAACTAITLRMYAERKGWPLEGIELRLTYVAPDVKTVGEVRREIYVRGPLDGDQCARLADIAERTPVTRVVKAGVEMSTVVRPAPSTIA
jgi:putative redox protein